MLDSPENGRVVITLVEDGVFVAEISCDEGYAIQGSETRRCVDGDWTGEKTTCHGMYQSKSTILCLTSRTTVTSACIQEEYACYRASNLCVFSRVQKGTKGLQRVYLGALSDITVVLVMRQSIVVNSPHCSVHYG